MSYLIFMKKLKDENVKGEQNSKFIGGKYISIFKGNEDCMWSENKDSRSNFA